MIVTAIHMTNAQKLQRKHDYLQERHWKAFCDTSMYLIVWLLLAGPDAAQMTHGLNMLLARTTMRQHSCTHQTITWPQEHVE